MVADHAAHGGTDALHGGTAATTGGDAVIVMRGLTRRYGRRIGIDGVDLRVDEGTIYGFLGPNGAGKTTAIRVLLGFLRPTAGAATVFGLDCWRQSARIKRDVGYLPGDLRIYPWMTLRSALSIVGRIRGIDLRTSGATLGERFGLEPTVPVRAMSRGMRQKLGLVLALAPDPRLLVLDEPTSGLDPLVQSTLLECLRERSAAGRTVFFSSHTLSEVEQLCDRVGMVRSGRLVVDEDIDALRRRARREVTMVVADDAVTLRTPSALSEVHRDGRRVQGVLTGSPRDFLRWAAEQPLEDLIIRPPLLEHVFRSFYDGPDDAEASS